MSDQPGPHNGYGLSPGEASRMAEELKGNPLLRMVLAEMDTGVLDVWRRSSSPIQREEQWHMMIAIQKLRQGIEKRIEDAAISDRQRTRTARVTV